MEYNILFLGCPVLDLSLLCDMQYLHKYQLKSDDCILATETHNSLFEELLHNSQTRVFAGGSAQNSARVCKWVLGSTAQVSFAGCVGKDETATYMKMQLEKDGVVPLYAEHETLSTGICACLLGSGGDRSMVAKLGASAMYNVDFLEADDVKIAMRNANIIFATGYFISHSHKVVETVLRFCKVNEKLVSFSLSACYICRTYKKRILEYLPFIDVIFGNFDEAKELLQDVVQDSVLVDAKSCSQAIAGLAKKDSKSKSVVVITHGSNPVSVCESGGLPVEYPVPKIGGLIDPTGCGDAMAGAFLASYVSNGSVSKSVQMGIKAALKIAQTRSCDVSEEWT